MRIIIGQAQREMIRKMLRPGVRVLEWGSGGSTLWLADRLPERARLTSIDHDAVWHQSVSRKIGDRENTRLLLRPPAGPIGRNATIEEERAEPLQDYIGAVDGELFDIILVDGVARSACMEQAVKLLAPRGIVFLHDAQRPWYDDAKARFIEHGTIGSCPDYASALLWWGGLDPEYPTCSVGALPIVLCFFTVGTPYAEIVEGLIGSCKRLGLEYDVRGVQPQGSWERNCAYKARHILDVYRQLDRPVLWCDADAVIHEYPLLLAGAEPDFAVNKAHRWQFNSATVYFNRTELGERILERWARLCEERPEIWDQIHLDSAWEEITATHPLRTMWLPQNYAKIFDLQWEERLVRAGERGPRAVIEQFQASRRYKTAVTDGKSKIMADPGAELIAARYACRPRTCWYDERFVLRKEPPDVALWGRRVAA
jgi:hypothetical protein